MTSMWAHQVGDQPSGDSLSAADDAQLSRWAYGRADSAADRQLAEAALVELARRADAARVAAESDDAARLAAVEALAAADAGVDDTADAADRHRRRMLATGLSGVAAAALALGAGVVVLAQPVPDPLAIFDGPTSEEDLEWAARITANVPGTITAGPRAIELGDRYVAVITRMSTVPDGQSTAWDSYCLTVSEGGTENGGWALTTTCTYPEKFERDGIVFYQGPSASGQGLDAVTWSTTSPPRLERHVPPNPASAPLSSVLDWLAYPTPLDPAFRLESLLDEPTELLMGPTYVGLAPDADDTEEFFDSDLTTTVHLSAGLTAVSEPRLCLQVTGPEGSAASTCGLLGDARREGLEVPISLDGRTWIVAVAPDGPNRTDTIRLAD